MVIVKTQHVLVVDAPNAKVWDVQFTWKNHGQTSALVEPAEIGTTYVAYSDEASFDEGDIAPFQWKRQKAYVSRDGLLVVHGEVHEAQIREQVHKAVPGGAGWNVINCSRLTYRGILSSDDTSYLSQHAERVTFGMSDIQPEMHFVGSKDIPELLKMT